ncbi:MAG: adenosylcobinamide-GDP ribazoletransferase [Rhodospirillaceae bacterium]
MSKRPLPIDVEPEPEAPDGAEAPDGLSAGAAAAGDDGYEDADDPPPYHPVVAAMLAAGVFLTRLPLPLNGRLTPALFGRAMGWFPLIGACLGLSAGIVFGLLGGFGVPSLVAAAVVVALLVLTTGGLHEDGLADVADGLGGGQDRESKLEIMHDSRVGSYGVLALVLSVVIRIAAIAALPSTWAAIKVLVVAGALSRAAMVAQSHWQPPARPDGLSATLGGPAPGATVLALALALGLAFLLIGSKAALVMVVAAVVCWGLIRLADHHVGGQTGDLLGTTQQVVEIVVLVMLAGVR